MKNYCIILLLATILNLHTTAAETAGRLWLWDFENIQSNSIPPATGQARGKLFAAPQELCRISAGVSGQGLEISGAQKSDKQVGGLHISRMTVDWCKGFTMLIWVKFSPLLSGKELFKTNKIIIGNCGVRGPGWLFYLTWGKLYLRSGDGKKSTHIATAFDGFDRWRQLGVVYDGTKAVIYVDGAAVLSENFKITPAARKDLFVGSAGGSNSQLYGTLDNLLLADRPFSAAEVAANYLKYKP